MTSSSGTPLADFASTIVQWQQEHGRHHLPWQGTRDPYRIWLSEIMLQQTQVATVIGYYERFLQRFPDIATLAAASQDEVMPYWAGLGYYARARNLHRCAQTLVVQWNGRFPQQAADIATLPGIGPSTAAAIAAFAHGERSPIMDGNVKRVFTRYFGIHGITSERATEKALWEQAHAALACAPASLDMIAYTQGLMDLGSQRCTRGRPACEACPLQTGCYARRNACQHELPTPKKKKAIPERLCLMLVARHNDHILLERQPSPGIWGGLWSLPKYEDRLTLEAASLALGMSGVPAQKMAAFSHTFTHFKLHIEPWYTEVGSGGAVMEVGSGRSWTAIGELSETALPAPVRKILDGLFF
ncbi:MAG: A/G-specific adenine glycosylase [Candidimonas sp.]|nr:A/G-specific adenine glycosylase [Candidimonas sp.]